MRDDEKMLNIGVSMFFGVIALILFLQVCYRNQNSELRYIHNTMESVQQEIEIAETRFSALSSADFLRGSVIGVNPKAETVSFSKTVHIYSIPIIEK